MNAHTFRKIRLRYIIHTGTTTLAKRTFNRGTRCRRIVVAASDRQGGGQSWQGLSSGDEGFDLAKRRGASVAVGHDVELGSFGVELKIFESRHDKEDAIPANRMVLPVQLDHSELVAPRARRYSRTVVRQLESDAHDRDNRTR